MYLVKHVLSSVHNQLLPWLVHFFPWLFQFAILLALSSSISVHITASFPFLSALHHHLLPGKLMQVVLSPKYIHSFTIVKIIQLINIVCTICSLIEQFPQENFFFSYGTGGNSGVLQTVVSRVAVNSSGSSCSQKRKPILYHFSFPEKKFLQSFP